MFKWLKRLHRAWKLAGEVKDNRPDVTDEELDMAIQRLVSDDMPPKPRGMARIIDMDVKDPFPPEEEEPQNDKTSK